MFFRISTCRSSAWCHLDSFGPSSAGSYCTWPGVHCEQCHVTELRLEQPQDAVLSDQNDWLIWIRLNQVQWHEWNDAKVGKFHEFPTTLPTKNESKWQPDIAELRWTSGCEWSAEPWVGTFASPEVCGLWRRSCLDRKHRSSPKRHVAGEAESES